jgi:hypothetical protein
MKKMLVASMVVWFSFESFAYDPATHVKIAEKAADLTALNDSLTFQRLGLFEYSLSGERKTFPSSTGKALSVSGLIELGSSFEDSRRLIQALYHFYDPAPGHGGRGLTVFRIKRARVIFLRHSKNATLVTPAE